MSTEEVDLTYAKQNTLIETADDVRSLVASEYLLNKSVFMRDIPNLPQPQGRDPTEPITLPFATAAGLRLLLDVLTDRDTTITLEWGDGLEGTVLGNAVEIAVMLEIREFGVKVLEILGPSPSCGIRFVIGQWVGIDTTAREYHPAYHARHKWYLSSHVSFNLGVQLDPIAARILEDYGDAAAKQRWSDF